jgi:O-antigen/teichoic acid export membrane protein
VRRPLPAGDPLLRNGVALVVNVGLTTVLGLAFWVVAARLFSTDSVGRGSALVSALLLMSALTQLNLAMVLPRFLPEAGRGAGALVKSSYSSVAVLSLVVGAGFVLVAGEVSGELRFLREWSLTSVCFVLAVPVWSVFALQDAVLTGLRRTVVVPVENAVFGAVKLGLLVVAAIALPRDGIFVAWVLGAALLLIPVNALIFRRYLPEHHRRAASAEAPLSRIRHLRRFIFFEYLGSGCYMLSTAGLPLLVLTLLGETPSAHFYVAWTVAVCLDLVSVNMAQSLTVETAGQPTRLRQNLGKLVPRLAALMVLGVVVLEIGAPYLLSLYGGEYAGSATGTLRLLGLAVIPKGVVVLVLAIHRIRRQVERIFLLQAVSGLGVLTSAALLGHLLGLPGVAAGWLLTQTCMALAVGSTLLRAMTSRRGSVPEPDRPLDRRTQTAPDPLQGEAFPEERVVLDRPGPQ